MVFKVRGSTAVSAFWRPMPRLNSLVEGIAHYSWARHFRIDMSLARVVKRIEDLKETAFVIIGLEY